MSSWVESASESFECRHSSECGDDARQVLGSLQRTRERLSRWFPRTVDELTVVLHDSVASLALTNPLLPMVWMATEPGARRYVTGWVGRRELHVLAPTVLRQRASRLPGSEEMLALTPSSLYARRVIAECNHAVQHSRIRGRGMPELRWAWLLEGAARYFSGETAHARAAIGQRIREGERPAFPPSIRDAPLLGGTVIGLVVAREGEIAAAQLAARMHPRGSRAALTKAFAGRSLDAVESDWRAQLERLTR
jgi:hypothetical protein